MAWSNDVKRCKINLENCLTILKQLCKEAKSKCQVAKEKNKSDYGQLLDIEKLALQCLICLYLAAQEIRQNASTQEEPGKGTETTEDTKVKWIKAAKEHYDKAKRLFAELNSPLSLEKPATRPPKNIAKDYPKEVLSLQNLLAQCVLQLCRTQPKQNSPSPDSWDIGLVDLAAGNLALQAQMASFCLEFANASTGRAAQEKNEENAAQYYWFLQAANYGSASAQRYVGYLYAKGSFETNTAQSVGYKEWSAVCWYLRAALQDDEEAQNRLEKYISIKQPNKASTAPAIPAQQEAVVCQNTQPSSPNQSSQVNRSIIEGVSGKPASPYANSQQGLSNGFGQNNTRTEQRKPVPTTTNYASTDGGSLPQAGSQLAGVGYNQQSKPSINGSTALGPANKPSAQPSINRNSSVAPPMNNARQNPKASGSAVTTATSSAATPAQQRIGVRHNIQPSSYSQPSQVSIPNIEDVSGQPASANANSQQGLSNGFGQNNTRTEQRKPVSTTTNYASTDGGSLPQAGSQLAGVGYNQQSKPSINGSTALGPANKPSAQPSINRNSSVAPPMNNARQYTKASGSAVTTATSSAATPAQQRIGVRHNIQPSSYSQPSQVSIPNIEDASAQLASAYDYYKQGLDNEFGRNNTSINCVSAFESYSNALIFANESDSLRPDQPGVLEAIERMVALLVFDSTLSANPDNYLGNFEKKADKDWLAAYFCGRYYELRAKVGMTYYRQEYWSKAREYYNYSVALTNQAARIEGNPAYCGLGRWLEFGKGYAQSDRTHKPVEYYKCCSEAGWPCGQYEYGRFQMSNAQLTRNDKLYNLGSCLVSTAAQADWPAAHFLLGEQFYNSKKYKEAFSWYGRAAEHGLAEGLRMVGQFYYDGNLAVKTGIKVDYAKAWDLFQSAAKQSEPWSLYLLGCLSAYNPKYKNPEKAKEYIRSALKLAKTLEPFALINANSLNELQTQCAETLKQINA